MQSETATPQATDLKPHLALIAVQLFFGTWPVVGKIALAPGRLSSTGLVAFRVGGAALAFILLRRALGGPHVPVRRKDYWRLALYSLLGVVLNQFLYVKGLALSTVINAALLGTTIPVCTLLVSIALGRERASRRILCGMAAAFVGVGYLINPAQAAFTRETTIGNFLLVANTLAYGTYLAVSQNTIKRYGALTVITWLFVMACAVAVPVGAYQLAQAPPEDLGAGVWLAVLYIVLVPTVGAYYLNAWALGRVAPSVVAAYIYLQPLFAFLLAPLVLGERVGARTVIAALFICAGVLAVTWRSRAVEEVSERPEALGH